MALEDSTFAHGGATFPLSAATTNSLLQDCDPAVYYVLSFYASVLQTYLGARLVAEAALAGVAISSAVAYQLPDDPERYLTEEQVKFPLLAVYRTRETLRDRTVTWRQDVSEWRVAYVLPPMTAGQRERLVPILRGVGRVLDNRTENAFDDAHLAGAAVLWTGYANLESIEVKSADYAAWEDGGDLTFPAVILTLEVKEREMPVTGAFDAITSVDSQFDETTFTDLVHTTDDLT